MTTFKALSDVVADAEDLLARLDDATSPEIRVLKRRVNSSIRDMRQRFKQRVKGTRRLRNWAGRVNPWVPATVVTLVALGLLYVSISTPDDR